MSARPSPRPQAQLSQLIAVHQQPIWRYLRFLGCEPGEADDLCQETFLAVIDRPIQRFGDGGARAYLRTVARNFYLRMRSQQQRAPRQVDLDLCEAAFDWAEGEDDGASSREALRQCLQVLDDQGRHALQLRFGEGLDRREIAARLQLSGHGVKSLLQRSYARLRHCVERRLS